MRQFIDTTLISLINESTERSVFLEEWEQSYETFANAVFAAREEMERSVFFNSLCYVKAELVFCRSQSSLKKKWDSIVFHRKGSLSY